MPKVTMFNPQSGVTQEASRDAYDRVYAADGWQLVDSPAVDSPAVDDALAAARAEADAAGVAWHHSAKADTIRAKIAERKAEAEKKAGGG